MGEIPLHIAIIMDGNGRWARNKKLDVSEGHIAGYKKIRPVISYLSSRGVKFVTVYAFSTENWERPEPEVSAIMDLAGAVIKEELEEISKDNIKLLHAGEMNKLSKELRNDIENAVSYTKNNTGLVLSVAFNYGGRQEIIHAVKGIIQDKLNSSEIDQKTFEKYLYLTKVPNPDLLIRTGGEFRLSNFLIWQSAYSEFFSTEVLWPDFGEKDIDKALDEYGNRQRRYGKRIV